MNQLKLIKIAVNLGDAESLINILLQMTHAVVPEEERRKMRIEDTLLRLSVEIWKLGKISKQT